MSSTQCTWRSVQRLSLAAVSFGSDAEQRLSSPKEQGFTNTVHSPGNALENIRRSVKQSWLIFSAMWSKLCYPKNWDQCWEKGWSCEKEPVWSCLDFQPIQPHGRMKGAMKVNHASKEPPPSQPNLASDTSWPLPQNSTSCQPGLLGLRHRQSRHQGHILSLLAVWWLRQLSVLLKSQTAAVLNKRKWLWELAGNSPDSQYTLTFS